MAKLACPCGNVISNVMTPCPYTGYIITDLQIETMEEGAVNSLQLMDMGRDVWECGECGRLAVSFPRPNDNSVKWYAPEDGQPKHLMRTSTGSTNLGDNDGK